MELCTLLLRRQKIEFDKIDKMCVRRAVVEHTFIIGVPKTTIRTYYLENFYVCMSEIDTFGVV